MFHPAAHRSTTAGQNVTPPLVFIYGPQPCADLRKSMPVTTSTITAGEHAKNFYLLNSADFWTSGGWLVTAVERGGVTHLRKGIERCVVSLPDSEPLHFNPNAQTRHHGFN